MRKIKSLRLYYRLFFLIFTFLFTSSTNATPPPYFEPHYVYGPVASHYFSWPNMCSNARSIAEQNITDVPWLVWSTGLSWNHQSVFSYWDDQYFFWTYPDSFTKGEKTSRCGISSDHIGNMHISWHQLDENGITKVFYRRYTLNDSSWGPITQISFNDSLVEGFPVIDTDGNNNPWIFWECWVNGGENFLLLAQHSSDGGISWDTSNVDTLYKRAGNFPLYPTVFVDQSNNDVHIVFFSDIYSDSLNDILYKRYDAQTQVWTSPEIVADNTQIPGSFFVGPSIVVDSKHNPHMVFLQIAYPSLGNILLYTTKEDTSWSEPDILFPEIYPDSGGEDLSLGIDEMDVLYLVFTLSEQLSLPFDLFFAYKCSDCFDSSWSEKIVITDTLPPKWVRGPEITARVPSSGDSPGPGIMWCFSEYGGGSDIYYMHLPLYPFSHISENKDLGDKFENSLNIEEIYPNPGSHKIKIKYWHNFEYKSCINLTVYSLSGRPIVKLRERLENHGRYSLTWDRRNEQGKFVPSGIYFIVLEYNGVVCSKKVTILR